MNRNDLEPIILNEATNEIKHQYLSAKKARNEIGWESEYELIDGLKETILWYTKFFNNDKGII
jgi:CDP-glucose 4,6-dehydratase